MASSLPYHEPGIEDILILGTFLLALNVLNSVLDHKLYCGLVGQVLLGVAWGTPGAAWLSEEMEHSIVQLGYLGLIMVVFEGGLSASIATMSANLPLSTGVAITGIAAPMGLSFLLGPLMGASSLQCFSAGAALCATSLGTTFTVLGTSGLAKTRLGSVLSTAAMMDDVVGLVMVEVVSSLGSTGAGGIPPVLIVRPVFVSLAFAVVVPVVCRYVLRPVVARIWRWRGESPDVALFGWADKLPSAFLGQTGLILGMVAGAAYAGASVLLAAYLAGITGSWWRDELAGLRQTRLSPLSSQASETVRQPTPAVPTSGAYDAVQPRKPGVDEKRNETPDVYEKYYQESIDRVLKPFFFASVGFSIPISQMFTGAVVWRGIIYTILMLIGKFCCGAWLVWIPGMSIPGKQALTTFISSIRDLVHRVKPDRLVHQPAAAGSSQNPQETSVASPAQPLQDGTTQPAPSATINKSVPPQNRQQQQHEHTASLSLYPAGIVSFAMVARGEIGFLISSVAETKGIFRRESGNAGGSSEIFLVITWAIMLCTILGPLGVGLLVRRVKKLEKRSAGAQVDGEKRNVLGAWGVA